MGIFDHLIGTSLPLMIADKLAYQCAVWRKGLRISLEDYLNSHEEILDRFIKVHEEEERFKLARKKGTRPVDEEFFYRISQVQKEEICKQSLVYFSKYQKEIEKSVNKLIEVEEIKERRQRELKGERAILEDPMTMLNPYNSPQDFSSGCLKSFKP